MHNFGVKTTGAVVFQPDKPFYHPVHKFILGNPDGLVVNPQYHADYFNIITDSPNREINYVTEILPLCNRGLEIKTVGHKLPYSPDDGYGWGEPQTDQIPINYRKQLTVYAAVTGIMDWDLAALFGQSPYVGYQIRISEKEMEDAVKVLCSFWNDHVLPKVPPKTDGLESTKKMFFYKNDFKDECEANNAAYIAATNLAAQKFYKDQTKLAVGKDENFLLDYAYKNKSNVIKYNDKPLVAITKVAGSTSVDWVTYAKALEEKYLQAGGDQETINTLLSSNTKKKKGHKRLNLRIKHKVEEGMI